jgi:ribosomal-protein-alanine N-acetyltransferase
MTATSRTEPTLRFEQLREDRIPRILEIEKQVNSSPWSERSFRNELDHKDGIFLVALMSGEVVGYGGIWLIIDEVHITTLAVEPQHQRKGIGRKMLKELLIRAKDAGMKCATLEVRASNTPAIAIYQQAGFEISATRKAYYPDNKEDAYVMWLFDLSLWNSSSPGTASSPGSTSR